MGQEHKAKGVTVQLGPVAGPLGRAPEGGRNWEGFSPDPYLSECSSSKDACNLETDSFQRVLQLPIPFRVFKTQVLLLVLNISLPMNR